MNSSKRLLRSITLLLALLGAVFGGLVMVVGKRYWIYKIDWPAWAETVLYLFSIIAGAALGFAFVWFIYWFATNLFEEVPEE